MVLFELNKCPSSIRNIVEAYRRALALAYTGIVKVASLTVTSGIRSRPNFD